MRYPPSLYRERSSQQASLKDHDGFRYVFVLFLGVHVNGIEFPVVKLGQARLRVSIMPQHTKEHLDTFVSVFETAMTRATAIYERQLKVYQEKMQREQTAKL